LLLLILKVNICSVLINIYQPASLVAQTLKDLPAMWEIWVWSLVWEDPLEKGMATHSSILAWRIPQTEEPGRLQSIGSQRVRHDWVTFTFTFTFHYITKDVLYIYVCVCVCVCVCERPASGAQNRLVLSQGLIVTFWSSFQGIC